MSLLEIKEGLLQDCFVKKISKRVSFKVKQSNLSFNKSKYTLRGFHYQIGKYSEIKIIKCLKGKIYDIIVDLRKKFTYKNLFIKLDDKNNKSILLPEGCANAFLTLEDNTAII